MPRRAEPSTSASPKARVTRESLGQMFGLYRFMRPYRGKLTIGVIMLIGSSALGIFFPLLSGLMINSKTHEAAFHIALLAISILFVQAAMSYFQSLFQPPSPSPNRAFSVLKLRLRWHLCLFTRFRQKIAESCHIEFKLIQVDRLKPAQDS